MEPAGQAALHHAGRTLSMIPVGLKEAALDSPTFRATAVHFSDQVEVIEKWLDAYVKAMSKLVHELSSLEETLNSFLLRAVPPSNVSEAVLDHDYTLLAMKRFGEGSREWWSQVIMSMKKIDGNIVEPIKAFMVGELRNFKDARKYLEQSQKAFDSVLARYVSQSKTKEPSSLREDAFQVHESRKAYLKASLDFCLLAPQLRYTTDKLLVKVSYDQWKEMRRSWDNSDSSFAKWETEMDRVRGWGKEMEAGESIFRRELQYARREIAESAAQAAKPSRELEDYNLSTVAFLGSKGPSTVNRSSPGQTKEKAEKQGWLFLRTLYGKPARTLWVRRWFYVKHGIFGWLVQGAQSGGVEESEKIGVLLCNVKPAVQEDRRFCFEVKTKNQTILIQAETQVELMEWLGAFEVAKTTALDVSAIDEFVHPGGIDPAFAITPASIPEFAAKSPDGHTAYGGEDIGSMDKIVNLPVPDGNSGPRGTSDTTGPRRSTTMREESESTRDHASRLMQKLDLHRKSPSLQSDNFTSSASTPPSGIASLISASHNILPVYSSPPINHLNFGTSKAPLVVPPMPTKEAQPSTLAPSTLANPPAPTNLSKAAVIVSGERGIGIGRSDATGGMPSGIMANLWGSSNWGYVNRLEQASKSPISQSNPGTLEAMPIPTKVDDEDPMSSSLHRKDINADIDFSRLQTPVGPTPNMFPSNYPLELKTQEAQFNLLFPNVPRDDNLLLVFRATWNPNDQQEFPGRIYVTRNELYFYSHHLGLVLISAVRMDSIMEVTAAPGKNCDFIFLHLSEGATKAGYSRLTIKTFLEPLRLLQSRLNFLIDAAQAEEILSLEEIIQTLMNMEKEQVWRSSSIESGEDVSENTPIDGGIVDSRHRDLKQGSSGQHGPHPARGRKQVTKFRLPSQAVLYEPPGMQRKAVERQFDVSPKALFHVMFGDKSAVFQLLYHERRAQKIAQGPWVPQEGGHMRRDFKFQIDYIDTFRRARQADVIDYQVIDIWNDHICYVVTDMKTPWHLPHHRDFMLVTRIVITYLSKAKCNLAIYTNVDWSKAPTFSKGLVERQALDDSSRDALDLADVIAGQVRKLGAQSRVKKAIRIFGQVGKETSISLFSATSPSQPKRPHFKQRSLATLLLEDVRSFGESCVSSVMLWAFAIMRTVWKITSVDRIILIALVMSLTTNMIVTSKDTTIWWQERNAANFMNRIGVGPNHVMGKAVYIRDLDEVVHSLPTDVAGQADSKCLTQFRDITNVTNIDSHDSSAGVYLSQRSAKSTAVRLRRARQNFGSYRHDLTVAMRLVNNVERELIKSEWENWLLGENIRCRQIQSILEGNQSTPPTMKGETGLQTSPSQQSSPAAPPDASDKHEELTKWHEGYCGSCKREQDLLLGGKSQLAFE